ncbi:hypothetical protein FKW77_000337 [Venturia effusa]|uniref:Uncharacterized protein n=1 Tax=Venturia effusa TaxID=50376 RepID=A0A517LA84_9PEZI|nr:hypothetical protein FKW77_000337 [Venturia effusa]
MRLSAKGLQNEISTHSPLMADEEGKDILEAASTQMGLPTIAKAEAQPENGAGVGARVPPSVREAVVFQKNPKQMY